MRVDRSRMHRALATLTLATPLTASLAASSTGALALPIAASLALASTAVAQVEGVPITGDRLGGFVLPIEPGTWNARFTSTRANTWKVDSTQRLFLDGQVNVQLGPYDFYAEQAVVWIERIPSERGVITQIAVWFPATSEPTKAAGLGASGSNLLITASTLGETSLRSVLPEPTPPKGSVTLRRGELRLAAYLRGLAEKPPPLRSLPEVRRPAPPPPPPPLEVGGHAPPLPSADTAAPARPGQRARKRGEREPGVQQHETAHPAESVRAYSDLPGPDVVSGAAPIDANKGDWDDEALDAQAERGDERSVIAPDSLLAFVADSLEVDTKADIVTLTGGTTLDVLPRNPGAASRMLQMRAERAVIFLKPGTCANLKASTSEVSSDTVLGIYLEGDVTGTDFDYTVRAKRAYYDFTANRATLVDGVLRTRDRKGIALVARAAELRQYSQEQWQADKVTVSTSEFFTPHLSVGVERATITRTMDEEFGTREAYVQGSNVTVNAGTTPFFWFPGFEGTAEDIPLRGLGVGYSEDSGVRFSTRWDLLSLMGLRRQPGTDITLYSDIWTSWGAGAGARGTAEGANFDVFGLYDFGNIERTSAGRNVRAPNEFRGVAGVDRTFDFTQDTKLQLQANYVSDESFLQTFRVNEFASRFQRETSAYLDSIGDRSEFALLLSYPTNGVITNSAQLAGRPYQVAKYPEGSYKRVGDKLFNFLTWTQEYSASLMAIRFGKGTTDSTGVRNNTFNLLGQVMPNGRVFTDETTLRQLYQANGYTDETASRLYTRQELAMPMGKGGFNLTPFASAAVSGYLSGNQQAYSPNAETVRGLVAGGVRASTDILAKYDSAEIDFLDVHRLRHVVTPYLNGWYGWDTTAENAYAIYDQDVEGATGGAVVTGGVRQRFQTMRGGPGNWQSVDWLVVDAGVSWNDSSDSFARNYTSGAQYRQSPFPQYFTWRPELSQWGRIAYGSFKWAASNSLTLSGNLTYLLDSTLPNQGAGAFGIENAGRGSIGASMQHTPDVRTFIEYRAINNNSPENIYLSDQLLAGGIAYQISRTYQIAFTPTYDLQENDFRAFSVNLSREMPDFTLMANVGYDAIVGEYFGGVGIRIGGDGGAVGSSMLSSDR